MKKFNYYSRTEIVFGEDVENQCGELCKRHGGSRIFIVYGGGSVVKSGLLDRVVKSIEDAGLSVMSMGGAIPNPVLSHTRELIAAAIEFKADMILGIGGGSSIDSAKMVAHGTANPDVDVWAFWSGTKLEKTLPIGAIPTLPATGTETSDSAVITNDEVEPMLKRGLNTNLQRCRFALMDPKLCMTIPKFHIGSGVTDIFMHNAERYFAKIQGNHLSDEIAYGIFKTIMKYGRMVIKNPNDYEAWSEVMWCGTLAHNGISGLGSKGDTNKDGDWSCHQFGHTLSSYHDSIHGASLSAVFPAWANYVMDADYARFASFGRNVLGLEEKDDVSCAKMALDGIIEFFKDLEMPINITDLIGHEVSDADVDMYAEHCSFNRTRTIGCVKALDVDDMRKIYSASRK